MPSNPSIRKKRTARAIAPGATLGRFRVVRVVSRRPGIDTVVEAKTESGTRVGLTVLGDAFNGDPSRRSATIGLARTRAELEHPNLLPLRGPWQSSGRAFYASVAPGRKTLADRLRDGPLEPAAAVRIAADVAGALELAAAKGLVHRDLTPNAIVIADDAQEHALLGDFGITSPFGPGCELLRTSGCIDYRSPEELRGEPARPRSTVYALTCILVECLTGAPPYRHDRPLLTLHAHLVESPPRISERVDGLSPRIDAVIAKGMAKDPRERFRSPAQLVEAAGKALGVDARMPLAEAARKQRAHEKTVVRERRRAGRRDQPASRREKRRTAIGAAVRRRPGRVTVWAGLALFASAMSGFATGSADWSADRAPAPRTATSAAAAAVQRDAAHAQRVEYLRTVDQTVARLGERRAKARHRLRVARRAPHQAAAANALSGAYRRARKAVPKSGPPPFADVRLVSHLRDAEHSYRALAAAARKSDGRAWVAARRAAVRSERRIARALGELRSA